ncbi:MAG: rhomboid family intramembrane serine protease [Gammaproteobacteria bacterium]|nr:rhomboid family intramembrane serine protease [Gammaproteobacteria bacterium]
MNDDMRVVFESGSPGACADRALVLASLQIPHEIIADAGSCALIVPARYSAQAAEQLMRYDAENPPPMPKRQPAIVYQNALPGIFVYAIVVCLIAGLSARSWFALDWIAAGRIDGALMRAGEWWRTITALTLHAGLRHLVGNLIFGCLFGLFAGRLLGPGVAWLAILLAGVSGNLLNALLLEATHRSIGASTAVFAALGLVAGFVWRGKLMAQDRWPYRVGPIVGGFALLMYTGTGGPNTDVGAHLMGFLSGLVAGTLLAPWRTRLLEPRWQIYAGTLAVLLVCLAWMLALLGSNVALIM